MQKITWNVVFICLIFGVCYGARWLISQTDVVLSTIQYAPVSPQLSQDVTTSTNNFEGKCRDLVAIIDEGTPARCLRQTVNIATDEIPTKNIFGTDKIYDLIAERLDQGLCEQLSQSPALAGDLTSLDIVSEAVIGEVNFPVAQWACMSSIEVSRDIR